MSGASIVSLVSIWFWIAFCGLLAWPLAALLFFDESDRGYFAAKPLGWLIAAYLSWLASYWGIPFSSFGGAIGIVGLLGVFALTVQRPFPVLPIRQLVGLELGFVLALVAGSILKSLTPDIEGLEKFMDFAFVNAALRADTMPPADPWWGGAPINYYYFGHMAAGWLISVSGVPPDHGFNLMLAVLMAFAATLSFRVVEGALRPGPRLLASLCGLAASLLIVFGGNFHSVLYGPLRALSATSLDREFRNADSTRFIGFDPPTADKAFTEMPSYGFAAGDLHAHLLNLPVGLLIVLVLVRLVQRLPLDGVRRVEIVVLSLLFAICAMANSWDAVSYGLMMAMTALMLLLLSRVSMSRLLWLALAGFAVVGASLVLAAPFLVSFQPFASRIAWSEVRTPLWQLGVLYAHVLLPVVLALAAMFGPSRQSPGWRAAVLLAATSLLLVALPEIAHLQDIYGEEFRRANTMFKLTFVAQPLAVMASVIVVGLLLRSTSLAAVAAGALIAVPLLSTLSYAGALYGERVLALGERTPTVAGLGFLDRDHLGDRALVEWLQAQDHRSDILIVEAPVESFSRGARLSAMTGVPAVLGWPGHEYFWRSSDPAVSLAAADIDAFFRSRTPLEACAFVLKYGVTHIAIGSVEYSTYPELDPSVFEQLGTVVVAAGSSRLVEVRAQDDPEALCRR